jgi:hypothetical protein
MSTDTTPAEKLRVFNDVLRRMKDFTGPAIKMICGGITADAGELVGTGTVIDLRGRPYLVTAQHVAAEMLATDGVTGQRKYPEGLCHSAGNGELMVRVINPWTAVSGLTDLAVTRLESDLVRESSIVPLRPDRFAPHSRDLNDDVYFVHGWPGHRSRFTSFEGRGVMAASLPYGGWLAEGTAWPHFDPAVHIALTYPATDLIDERGRAATFVPPGGLSGSLLWKTNRAGAGPGWSPSDARVVGLVTRWDQDGQILIATRIEHLRGFLLDALRMEFAYFRWHDRGRPPGDDWADWFAAEREVGSLTE